MNRKKNEKIVHPIFLECIDFSLDPFWQQIFSDLAFGHYPKGTGITNDILYIKNKGKTETIALNKSPKKTFLIVTIAFREKLGLSSSFDKKKRKAELEEARKDTELDYNKWSLIKKKAIREYLLHRYICTLVRKYQLPIKEGEHIYNSIDIAFNFGALSNDDVHLENGKITCIDGIDYDKDNKAIKINQKCESISKEEEKKKPKYNLDIAWKKYIETILSKNKLLSC